MKKPNRKSRRRAAAVERASEQIQRGIRYVAKPPFSRINRERFNGHIAYAMKDRENRTRWDGEHLVPLITEIAALATPEGEVLLPQSEPTICLSLSVSDYVSEPEDLLWLRHLLSDVDQDGILSARFGEPVEGLLDEERVDFEWRMRMGYKPFLRMVPEQDETEVGNHASPRLQLITNGGFFLPASEPEENALASALYDYPEELFGLSGAGKLFDLWLANHPIKSEDVRVEQDEIIVHLEGVDQPITVSKLDGMRAVAQKGARDLNPNLRHQKTVRDVAQMFS